MCQCPGVTVDDIMVLEKKVVFTKDAQLLSNTAFEQIE